MFKFGTNNAIENGTLNKFKKNCLIFKEFLSNNLALNIT